MSLKRLPDLGSSESVSDVRMETAKIPRVYSVPSSLSPTLTAPKHSMTTQMIQVRQCRTNPMLMDKWIFLLQSLGNCSDTWMLLQSSAHWREHAGRILDGSAPSTALKYISACSTFLQTLTELRVSLTELSEIQMADILITMSLAKSSTGSGGSCASTIKALRWLHRVAGVSPLQVVHSAMINSFLIQKIPRDRKEAPPLPLWLLVQWERRVLMSSCSILEIILLGSFLLMAWASLRFSDAQRIEMTRMVLTDGELRGVIWRSKTTTLGMPFGAINSGLLSKGAHSWIWKYIKTLDELLYQNGIPDVDFLLPHCDADAVRSGWRPQIAQHRGSQKPLQEPAVTLEIFSKKLPEYTFQWFTFGSPSALELDPPEQVDEQDQESDSSSSTSSSSDEEAEKPVKSDEGAAALPKHSGKKGIFPETLVYGQYRCVVHAMIAADESAHWLPQRDGVHLKPACGRPMKSNGKLLDCVTAEHQLCQHAACRKFWAHFKLECDP
eukprot:s2040_g10.t1